MAEETTEQIKIKREPLPYNPKWFLSLVTKKEYNLASEALIGKQVTEEVPVNRLYRSKASLVKLKEDLPLDVYDEITKADAVITFVGSSVGRNLDEQIVCVSDAFTNLCEEFPDRRFLFFSGGGSRGNMLDAQIVKMKLWINSFRRLGDKNTERVTTNAYAIGVGPDKYTPEKISEHPEMPVVEPGPGFDMVILANTSSFNGGDENAWSPTSELLRTLSFLKKTNVREITVVAGGGATTQFEALNKLRFGADLMVLKGSGRFADLLFELKQSLGDQNQAELRPSAKVLLYEMESIISTGPKFDKNADMIKEVEKLFEHIHWVDLKNKNGEANVRGLSDMAKRLLKL